MVRPAKRLLLPAREEDRKDSTCRYRKTASWILGKGVRRERAVSGAFTSSVAAPLSVFWRLGSIQAEAEDMIAELTTWLVAFIAEKYGYPAELRC
jgi:hypothetical protein